MNAPEPLRVVAATLRHFDCSYSKYVENPVELGQVVVVREGDAVVYGVVAELESGPEDPTRPLQPIGRAEESATDVMRAHPHIRQLLRTRVRVITCGHAENGAIRPYLPPVPPPLLARVEPASEEEVRELVAGGHFLAQLLAAPDCDDAVAGAAIRRAMRAFRTAEEAHAFAVEAGKELARILRAEPARLTTILRAAT